MGDRSPFPGWGGLLGRVGLRVRQQRATVAELGDPAAPETPTTPLDAEEASIFSELGPGERLGSYIIEDLLARGGMAWVFRGRRLADDAPVALKVLRPKLAAQSEFLDIFLREAETLAELDHPNIVKVWGRGMARALHFLVMEYVAGASLGHIISDEVALSLAHYKHLVREICAGVSYLHGHGVVHGDLKPANVLVGSEGSVKLTDFGLAQWLWESGRQSEVAVRYCTPMYAAPELLSGEGSPSVASDIFALGVTFLRLFGGTLPPRAPLDPASASVETFPIQQDTQGRHAPSGLPPELERILDRAMAPDPADRYPTVGHLRAELEYALSDPQASALFQ
ncbi:MAG: serine/threonine protein kinase [Candidatus Sumerlaeaceae bacterium]|nr:serine/threonine protein kinase [Candidatus Sumerlaeaceae bacterium]